MGRAGTEGGGILRLCGCEIVGVDLYIEVDILSERGGDAIDGNGQLLSPGGPKTKHGRCQRPRKVLHAPPNLKTLPHNPIRMTTSIEIQPPRRPSPTSRNRYQTRPLLHLAIPPRFCETDDLLHLQRLG